jgi:hypothetical protein
MNPARSARQQSNDIEMIVSIVSLVQEIAMNIGPLIGPQAGNLMAMLIPTLDIHSWLISEVLPTMDAVARAIKNEFAPYLPPLLDRVFGCLASAETVRSAAVFVSDIVCLIENIDLDLINRFVQFLPAAFEQSEDLSFEARLAAFTALCDLAKYVGPNSGIGSDPKKDQERRPENEQFLPHFRRDHQS